VDSQFRHASQTIPVDEPKLDSLQTMSSSEVESSTLPHLESHGEPVATKTATDAGMSTLSASAREREPIVTDIGLLSGVDCQAEGEVTGCEKRKDYVLGSRRKISAPVLRCESPALLIVILCTAKGLGDGDGAGADEVYRSEVIALEPGHIQMQGIIDPEYRQVMP
jgi:hypothetical protein